MGMRAREVRRFNFRVPLPERAAIFYAHCVSREREREDARRLRFYDLVIDVKMRPGDGKFIEEECGTSVLIKFLAIYCAFTAAAFMYKA